MGWGTTFKADIYLSRIIKDQIEDKTEQCIQETDFSTKMLISLLSGAKPEHRRTEDEDYTSYAYEIINTVEEIIDEIKQNAVLLYKLELSKEATELIED